MSKRKLSIIERKFADQYIANDGNALQAYLTVRPTVSANTAATNGSKLLKRTHVQEYIDTRLDEESVKSITARSAVIKRLDRLATKAEDLDQINTAITGTVEIAKIQGHYKDHSDAGDTYQAFITNILQVNVTGQDAGKQDDDRDVIDMDT